MSVELELWNIFTFYTLHGNPQYPDLLKASQFVKLAKDCQMLRRNVTAADINVVYTAEVKRKDRQMSEVQKMMAMYDHDGDGEITMQEFVKAMGGEFHGGDVGGTANLDGNPPPRVGPTYDFAQLLHLVQMKLQQKPLRNPKPNVHKLKQKILLKKLLVKGNDCSLKLKRQPQKRPNKYALVQKRKHQKQQQSKNDRA